MSTLNLGKIRFNWTGAYNNSTAYVANDVVSSGGNSYICKLASTGNAVSNGTYWDLMSQAGTNGTNGTDLGTVLTAQGDVVYRDGSGLQKLAKPASDKFLKNTSGGVVSWADAGGGAYTVVATVNCSSTSEAILTNLDTTYDHYSLVGSSLLMSTSGASPRMRFGTSGGMTTTGYDIMRAEINSGNAYYQSSIDYNYNDIYMARSNFHNATPWQFECMISRGVTSGGTYPLVRGRTGGMYGSSGNNFTLVEWGGSSRNSIASLDRVSVRPNAGTLLSGRITLFGIKHT